MVKIFLAAALAILPTIASAQTLAPVDGHNYTIYNAHNGRCALLIGPYTNDYVPIVMATCTGGTNELWRTTACTCIPSLTTPRTNGTLAEVPPFAPRTPPRVVF
ncbi:hypothetical protein C8R45DRAFT_1068808 [Mycena sanguinolenta]|nr:hypothetical protein C8R45DRAFT_1068808 [Mycena sanguinolenta]